MVSVLAPVEWTPAAVAAQAADTASNGWAALLVPGVFVLATAGLAFWGGYLRTRKQVASAEEQLQQSLAAQRAEHELTLAAQREALAAERETNAASMKAQQEQQERTLRAVEEQAEQNHGRERTRLRTEAFGRAAEQMGADDPVVRMAGVYAMAALADEWDDDPAQQMKCVGVLCGYLRLPPRQQDDGQDWQAGEDQVRSTIVDTIREHCQQESPVSWGGLDLDFAGATFPVRTSFEGMAFVRDACFRGATFVGDVRFSRSTFTGDAQFDRATFAGDAEFTGATFSGDAWFSGASLAKPIDLTSAERGAEVLSVTVHLPDGTSVQGLPLIPAST